MVVTGFAGGFVRHDDLRHPEVRLARRLEDLYGNRIRASVFENAKSENAYRFIRRWLRVHPEGALTCHDAKPIFLYGHSWGASASIALARELELANIAVRLAVEIDSIAQYRQDM